MGKPICRPCKDRRRISLAHRIVDGTPMCNECFKGKPSNGVRAELAAEILKKKPEGNAMGKCKRGRDANHRGHCCVWRGFSAPLDSRERITRWVAPESSAAIKRGRQAKSNGAVRGSGQFVTLNATAELCDAIWNGLSLEKKAALLNRLAEAN